MAPMSDDRDDSRIWTLPERPIRVRPCAIDNNIAQQKSSEDVRSIYASKPLQAGKQEIRLLTLERDEDGIHGFLDVVDISEPRERPSWTALSYCWASYVYDETSYEFAERQDVPKSIQLEDIDFPVGDNLWRALTALLDLRDKDRFSETNGVPTLYDATPRPPYEWQPYTLDSHSCRPSLAWTHYFWIDAICIDQETILERNHQVGMMKWIYTEAEEVVACLNLGCHAHRRTDLLQNPYWGRVWILQELVLAQQLIILHGGECYDGDAPSMITHFPIMRTREEYWDRLEGVRDRDQNMWGLLQQSEYSNCKDPRDKVFALLGLMPEDYPVKANYALSTRELFVELVRAEPLYGMFVYVSWWLMLGLERDENSEEIYELVIQVKGVTREYWDAKWHDPPIG